MKRRFIKSKTSAAVSNFIGTLPASVYAITALVFITLFMRPYMLEPRFLFIMARQAAPLGLAVCGQLLVIGVGTIDLSVGGVFLFVNYILSSGLFGDSSIALILASIFFGLLVGVINGLLIAKVRASAFIITLGMGTLLVGLVIFLSSGRPPGNMPELVKLLGGGRIGMVPISALIWFFMSIVLAAFLRFLAYGRIIAAIGDSPEAARLSGLPVDLVVMWNHILSALFGAIGGILLAGFIGSGRVEQVIGVEINALAATILGGVLFGKMDGKVYGPFFGVWTITLLTSLLFTIRLGEPGRLMGQALIIYLGVLIQQLRTRET